MKKSLFSAVALTVLFVACKDDNDTITPQMQIKATKLFLNSVSEYDSTGVTYNAANNVATFSSFAQKESYAFYSELVYGNGKLAKLLVSEDAPTALEDKQDYEYNAAGDLSKVMIYGADKLIDAYDSIVYDNNGRYAAMYSFGVSQEPGTEGRPFENYGKTLYDWDSKGNLIKEIYISIIDGQETDSITTVYTYDDKVNFIAIQPELYLIHPREVAIGLSVNNILTLRTEYSNYSEAETNVYTYDGDGYPVTRENTSQSIQDGEVVYTRVENTSIRYVK
ncbi:hypothetical protein [Chitinophaga filiformis]|uniref:Uncharacterized protein n=1 Tax=Chitinophaga filiformis TaxID=104663 RepID=A0A1G8CCS5_CHIFI|nr:hypothetical protein [Chitinophaga filiformis]SDH42660.1 hypothetical protein SAMN04488121_11279 [Chitinophaga filiformis]